MLSIYLRKTDYKQQANRKLKYITINKLIKKFMTKKILKITGIVLGVAVLLYIGWSVYLKIRIDRGDLIKWDNKFYTKEELAQKFPPQEYNVPAKNTPEEVYANFRQALLKNDIEGALAQIRTESKEKYSKIFQSYANLKILGEKYPDKINLDHEYGNFSAYNFKFIKEGKEIESSVEFIKNSDGYWQIDQI